MSNKPLPYYMRFFSNRLAEQGSQLAFAAAGANPDYQTRTTFEDLEGAIAADQIHGLPNTLSAEERSNVAYLPIDAPADERKALVDAGKTVVDMIPCWFAAEQSTGGMRRAGAKGHTFAGVAPVKTDNLV